MKSVFLPDRTSPSSGLVKTPGPIATEMSQTWSGPTRMAVDTEDNQEDDIAGDGDAGGNNATNLPLPAVPPTQPPAGSGGDAPGGGDDPDNGDENMEDNDSNKSSRSSDASDEGKPEDPEWVGMGKFYKAQTPNRKQMVKMFRRYCDLTDHDTNAIIMYFGVYSKARLAEFLHGHWKDTFTQWQKRNPNRDGTEWAIVLSPPQQDRIRCPAWACHHRHHIPWPAEFFSVKDLRPRHFEPIHAQMEHEDERKITIKMIPKLQTFPSEKIVDRTRCPSTSGILRCISLSTMGSGDSP